MTLPQLPAWDAIHPLVVHFPIALLLVAPVFVMLALAMPRRRAALVAAGAVIAALGTAGAFLAVATGEAAEDAVPISAAAEVVLERHEELAESARLVFTVLTGALVAAAAALALRPGVRHRWAAVGLGAILMAWLPAGLLLANIGHEGGRLVHEFGVHASMAGPTPQALQAPPRERDDD